MARPHSSFAESSATILVRYLADRNLVLDLGTAARILDAADLHSTTDMKQRARNLKAALATAHVELKHTHVLELVAKLEGYASWMRARVASTQHTDRVYFLQTVVEGVTQGHTVSESISDAVSTLLRQAIDLIPTRAEPAFCELKRNSQAIVLDVSQASAPWFSLNIVAMNKWQAHKNGQAIVTPFDEAEQRQALLRIRDNIEQARPGALVLRGCVSERLGPCHYAVWELTNLQGSLQRIISDERELFLMFDAIACTSVGQAHGALRFIGANDSLDATRVWVDSAGSGSRTDPYTQQEAQQDLQRFLRWRRALPGSVTSAFQSIVQGGGNKEWVVKVDYEKLEAQLQQREMYVAELARAIGVSYRDIFRLRDYEMADAELVLNMASALDLTPTDLLKETTGTLGFEIDNGEMLLRMAAGAQSYGSLVGESVAPALAADVRVQLQNCIDWLEIAAMDAVTDGPIERRSGAELVQSLDGILNDLRQAGLFLIAGRDIRFVNPYQDAEGKQKFIPLNALVLSVDHRDATTRALWQPLGSGGRPTATHS
ncbi:glyoxalase superfamily protein [Bordetella bronchialis]|uniref:Glyoxalase-related protein domain-containing protein n=1 Tax=Bordetella bronchialis TaxID=463025 RepID=A0A193G0M5_9BORD|nr:glyoxalase superfamily protein [Bordetella bronchialis]ANN73415.1 hypothetical protein BAU08_20530 [Bordetella bronchialis]